MARKKRSPPHPDAAGPSRPPKKTKSTSCFSENTTGHSALLVQLETINHKLDIMNQKVEEIQMKFTGLTDKLKLEIPAVTNPTISDQVVHGRYELKIEGTIKKPVYTDSKVEGENEELLKVALYCNGKKVTSGPLASAKFEILVTNGEANFCASNPGSWTAEAFQQSLAKPRREVGSILKDVYMSVLANGEAVIDGLIFKDNSSWVDGKKWGLGIRLLDTNGVRVLEAISDCFRVLDRHGKANEKKYRIPLLTDGVECLKKVLNKRASNLRKKDVCTVMDFLQFYHVNPSGLKQIVNIEKESASWNTMIEHAKKCKVGPKLYYYQKNNHVLFFNCVYEVVGAKIGSHYRTLDELLHDEKELVNELKKVFFNNIKNGDFTADFGMVNGQHVLVGHGDNALQYDQTAGQQDRQPAGITPFLHDVSSQGENSESSCAFLHMLSSPVNESDLTELLSPNAEQNKVKARKKFKAVIFFVLSTKDLIKRPHLAKISKFLNYVRA